jgi:hypothetical protein
MMALSLNANGDVGAANNAAAVYITDFVNVNV